jgi:mono/diheme cytochrome c family protein
MCSVSWASPTRSLLPALAALAGLAAGPAAAQTAIDPQIYSAWRAMRQLDCARCHGADYTGNVGPSLLESARTRSPEEFKRLVLEGNTARGMPPYASVALAVKNVDGMYAYFRGRADGSIPAGSLKKSD